MRKMKKPLLILIMMLSIFWMGSGTKVYAAEQSQNGVLVETHLDKTNYYAGDQIIYSVYIQNMNAESISISEIDVNLPKGYVIEKKDKLEKKITPGENVVLKYHLKNNGNVEHPNQGDFDENAGGSELDQDETAQNITENKENDKNNLVDTGDHTKILFAGIVAIIAMVCIFLILHRNKKSGWMLLLVMAILLQTIVSPFVVRAAEPDGKVTIEDRFIYSGKQENICAYIMYKNNDDYVNDDTTIYSRGEWVQLIVDACRLHLDLENASESSFTDIQESPYVDAIRTAEIYGVVDSNKLFCPTEVVTREFAALTTIRLLAFQGQGKLTCLDENSITYKTEVYLALKTGIMLLQNGCFHPNQNLTRNEGTYILEKIKTINQGTETTESKRELKYKEDVLRLTAADVIDVKESYIYLRKNMNTGKIGEYNYFVIDDKEAYRIINCNEEGTELHIQYSKVESEDVLDYMLLQDVISNIDLEPADLGKGVTMVEEKNMYNQENRAYQKKILLNIDTSIALGKEGLPDLHVAIQDLTFNSNIEYDYSGGRIKNAYVGVEVNPNISIEPLENLNNDKRQIIEKDKIDEFVKKYQEGTYKPFAKDLPLRIRIIKKEIAPLVVAEFSFVLEAGGTFKVEWDIQAIGGIQIVNNIPRAVCQPDVDFSFMGDINAKMGVFLGISICDIFNTDEDLLAVGVYPNINVSADAVVHKKSPYICSNFNANLNVEIGMLKSCKICKWLGTEFSVNIFDENNSPFRCEDKHMEIGKEGISFPEVCSHKNYTAIFDGYVKGRNMQNIQNAEILIFKSDVDNIHVENPVACVKTTENGYFLMDIDDGEYKVVISAPGYVSLEKNIIIAPGEHNTKEFVLDEREEVVCRIGDVMFSSVADAIENANNGDIIVMITESREKQPLNIPENKEIVIVSEQNVTISRTEETMDAMITNKGKLEIQGPVTLEFDCITNTIIDNYGDLILADGVALINNASHGTGINNMGVLNIKSSSAGYGCVIKGNGLHYNFGIWNKGSIYTNDSLFLIKDISYGIVLEGDGIAELNSGYKNENVSYPIYEW